MPEGDTIFLVARRLTAALRGQRLLRSDFRVPRLATVDLGGALVCETVPRGKHLLTRLICAEQELTLHTHLRMDGQWRILGAGKRLPAALAPDARLILTTSASTAVAVKMPIVELVPTAEEDALVGHLGPDLLDFARPVADLVAEVSARVARAPQRELAAALLDQRNLAGLGNLWVNELCFLRGHLPSTLVEQADVPALVRLAVKALRTSAQQGIHTPGAVHVTTGDTRAGRRQWVWGRTHQTCRRCGTALNFREQVSADPEQRRTWWCPGCQH